MILFFYGNQKRTNVIKKAEEIVIKNFVLFLFIFSIIKKKKRFESDTNIHSFFVF